MELVGTCVIVLDLYTPRGYIGGVVSEVVCPGGRTRAGLSQPFNPSTP
jgi:hypothetical protein